MAVVSTLEKIAVKMLLNNGQDEQGNTKTVSVNLGSLNPTAYDASKALAVVAGIIPCLSRTLSSIQEVRTSTLDEE